MWYFKLYLELYLYRWNLCFCFIDILHKHFKILLVLKEKTSCKKISTNKNCNYYIRWIKYFLYSYFESYCRTKLTNLAAYTQKKKSNDMDINAEGDLNLIMLSLLWNTDSDFWIVITLSPYNTGQRAAFLSKKREREFHSLFYREQT